MAEANSARRQQIPLRVLLLSLMVLGHFLCSICHGAVAADTPADDRTAAIAQSAQAAQPTVGATVLHGLDEDGRSDCATAGDAGFDQRGVAAALLLLGLGAVLLVAALRPPPLPQLAIVRWLPAVVRGRAPLFLTLCIQRV